MHIRCPHCQNPIDVVDDSDLHCIPCPSCGSSFNLLPDDTVSHQQIEIKALGRFELIERIGAGAFGEVWKAKDTDLDRIVAVKVPRKGQLNASESEQFLREARSAAQLSHPHIVNIHEVGSQDGHLYIVSDLVQGVTLADRLTGPQLNFGEAAELCQRMTDALQHAHDHGVIHRDLKPSNIILDAEGAPHIMDFGLAKREAGEITMTVEGRILGTPAYMSPEQAQGNAHDADKRSDVYSLGVILFELLTGELPFRGNPRMLVHQVINEEPPSPRKLNNRIPRDLETICLKCLEKDPRKRYPTARELADELKRFLNGEPIQARPITLTARTWRWCKRYPLVSSLAFALLLSLVSGLLGVAWQWYRAEGKAEQNRRLLYFADMTVAVQSWNENYLSLTEEILHKYDDAELRGPEWYYLWNKLNANQADISLQRHDLIRKIAFSPDGVTVASADSHGRVLFGSIHQPESAQQIWQGGERVFFGVNFLQYSPDGGLLAYPRDGAVWLYDTQTGSQTVLDNLGGYIYGFSFSRDGQLAISAGRDEEDASTVRIWDVPRRTLLFQKAPSQRPTLAVAFSKDDIAATAGDDGIVLWDARNGDELLALSRDDRDTSTVLSVAFSPDGRFLASGHSDHVTRVWNLESKKQVAVLRGHLDEVRAVVFHPEKPLLATGSRDNSTILWNTDTYEPIVTYRESGAVNAVDFGDSGRWLATGCVDHFVHLRNMQSTISRDVLKFDSDLNWSVPEGSFLSSSINHLEIQQHTRGEVRLFVLQKGKIRVFESKDNREVDWSAPTNMDFTDMTMTSQQTELSAITKSGVIRCDSQTGQQTSALSGEPGITCHAYSPTGDYLVLGMDDGTVKLVTLPSGKVRTLSQRHQDEVRCVAWTQTGDCFATGSLDRTICFWDPNTLTWVVPPKKTKDWVLAIAFSPSGEILASAGFDPTIEMWNWRSVNEPPREFKGHSLYVSSLLFCRHSPTLFSASADRTIKLWDVKNGNLRFTFRGHSSAVDSLALSPDETVLASGGRDGTVKFWRMATEEDVKASNWYENPTEAP